MSIRIPAAVLAGLLLFVPLSVHAQQLQRTTDASRYDAERHLIESTLESVVAVIQEVTLRHEASGLGDRLRAITDHITLATHRLDPAQASAEVSLDDVARLRALLDDIADDLATVRQELIDEGSYETAERLEPVQDHVGEALRIAQDLERDASERGRVATEDGERWLAPGRYGDTDHARDDDRRASKQDVRRDRDRDHDGDIRDRDDRWTRHRWYHPGAFVGEYMFSWPYRNEIGVYRFSPAIRYNRVEGFVLGIGRRPMDWNDYGRGRLYGQVGYAFALDAWRYEVGLETRVDPGRGDRYGLKIGGNYHRNTTTNDAWKTSWLENSLAAFFFEHDFFDYYETEGWTLYAVQRVTPYAQVSAGYRQDDYRSLFQNTSWSLFGGDAFYLNPAIDPGEMRSLVFAVEGGRVNGLHHLPRGAAFRAEAEVGDGLGGDFAFTRYVADGRAYVPVNRFSSLSLRLRGGVAQGDFVPAQKLFSIGGVGSVRGYAQNGFYGTRMLVGNAEYIVDGLSLFDDLFDHVQLIGFFDAGWVNTFGTDAFAMDDVLPSAGLGIGLDDRAVRLELAWPLRDFGNDMSPSLWLRVAPSF